MLEFVGQIQFSYPLKNFPGTMLRYLDKQMRTLSPYEITG